MLSVENLIKLVSKAANGEDNFKSGAVGFNGYGFVFRDYDSNSRNSFINNNGSSKLCSIGAFRQIYKRVLANPDILRTPKKLLMYDPKLDLNFGGALKYLIPELSFGGIENLFDVWVFVTTPKNQMFPLTFYFGQSGTSIGGWTPDYHLFYKEHDFPQQFKSIINFNPFNFSDTELEYLIEALECSINKVPVSDFEGIYIDDQGKKLMGIRSGKPFVEFLKDDLDEKKNKETWSYAILGGDESFQLLFEYEKIIRKSLPPKIYKDYPDGIPIEIYQSQIEKHYEELIKFADNQKSRLAYMIMGVVIMVNCGKMTEALKEKILKYSEWELEENQLINEQDLIERKNHLMAFREKIKNYDGTKQVKTPLYTVTRLINEKKAKGEDITQIMKKNIDYSIND
ncbi:hypothetical protein LCGC14_1423420 [marine sediment metagenome]|uniref:Uncharacterized protein n=1 Tax=marine sediment metagenome TaxID=412755 RepID=A0A0F9JQH6_9ZZZZ